MQGLLQGRIAEKCPLGDLSEEAMKEREVREGLEVELHRRLPCSVSFTRGQERNVHFAIVGLPQVRSTALVVAVHHCQDQAVQCVLCSSSHAARRAACAFPMLVTSATPAVTISNRRKTQEKMHHGSAWIPQQLYVRAWLWSVGLHSGAHMLYLETAQQLIDKGLLMQGHSGVAGGGRVDFTDNPGELLQASPSIVLADHGPQADTGRVLSVAPLMGATAASDAGHARWLHVKVRPPARGLIKAARVTHRSLAYHRRAMSVMLEQDSSLRQSMCTTWWNSPVGSFPVYPCMNICNGQGHQACFPGQPEYAKLIQEDTDIPLAGAEHQHRQHAESDAEAAGGRALDPGLPGRYGCPAGCPHGHRALDQP